MFGIRLPPESRQNFYDKVKESAVRKMTFDYHIPSFIPKNSHSYKKK